MSSIQIEERSGASFRKVLLGMIFILPFLLRNCNCRVVRVTGYRSLRTGQTMIALLDLLRREVSKLFILMQLSLSNANTLEARLIFLKSAVHLDHPFWNTARSEFLSNLNCKVRALLKGSLGFVQTLKRDRTRTYSQTDGLRIIYQPGLHSLTLIGNILDRSKVSAYRFKIHRVELAIAPQQIKLTVNKLKTISRWSRELEFWSEGIHRVVALLASLIHCLNQPFCALPAKKAEGLRKLTLLGNTQNIQDQANYPKHQNDRYLPFVSKIEDSVQKLPERAIATLVESYLYLERSL